MDNLATEVDETHSNWDEAIQADNRTITDISKIIKITTDSIEALQKTNNTYHTTFINQNINNLHYSNSLGDNRNMLIHALEFINNNTRNITDIQGKAESKLIIYDAQERRHWSNQGSTKTHG